MPKKSLTPSEVEQLKEMVIKGTGPQDIADYFGIGIASVHNWKNKLKAQGVEIPSVRGKRTKGVIEGFELPEKSALLSTTKADNKEDEYRFIINGRTIVVTGPVKDVKVTKDGLEINY